MGDFSDIFIGNATIFNSVQWNTSVFHFIFSCGLNGGNIFPKVNCPISNEIILTFISHFVTQNRHLAVCYLQRITAKTIDTRYNY